MSGNFFIDFGFENRRTSVQQNMKQQICKKCMNLFDPKAGCIPETVLTCLCAHRSYSGEHS